jgi:AsmA-like C-terminal region
MKLGSPTASLASPSGKPRSAVTARRRLLLRVGLIAAAVVALAAVLLAVYWPFSQKRVVRVLEEDFKGRVTIGRYHSTKFTHPGCVAEDVELWWQTKSADNAPLVTVKKLTIRAHYWDLFLRPGYISRMVLEGLRVNVPPIGSGVAPMNIPDTGGIRARVGNAVADDALVVVARKDGEPLKFEIHSLKLSLVSKDAPFSYEVALRNPLPPGEIRSQGRFGPWNSSDGAETPVVGFYSFDRADLSVFHGIAGMLSSDGQFQGTLGRMHAKGKITIPDFEVTHSRHAVPAKSEYQAMVNGMDGDVTLERVDSTVLKTRVLARGTIAGRPGTEGKFASIDLAVKGGRIQDVLRIFVKAPKPPLNGTTDFRAHVVIPPGDAPFLKKVVLVGDFGIADAQFTKDETQESVTQLSERGAGKKPEDAQEDPDDLVSEIAGHAELRGGTATLTDLSFVVPDARATMHGTYNLIDEKIDLHGTLLTTAKFSETTGGFKSVLLKPFDHFFKRKRGGAKLPVQLTGTYHDPHPALEIVK